MSWQQIAKYCRIWENCEYYIASSSYNDCCGAPSCDFLTLVLLMIYRRKEVNCVIETKKAITKQKADTDTASKGGKMNKNIDISKFETYFNFKIPVKWIKPHQVSKHRFVSFSVYQHSVSGSGYQQRWTPQVSFSESRYTRRCASQVQ